jgi:hypothetical protein
LRGRRIKDGVRLFSAPRWLPARPYEPASPENFIADPGSRGFWERQKARPGKGQQKLDYHRLAALYIEIKSKQPKLSDSKIAEVIAKMWREPKEVIRKRLSSGVPQGWIEHLEKYEREHPGYIQLVTGHLEKSERDLTEMLSYKIPAPKKLSK